MDWIGAFLGTIFLQTIVGGAAILGVFYLWIGAYMFALGLLIPLAGILLYMFADLRDVPELDEV